MRTSAEQRSAHSIDATLCKMLQVRAKYQGLTTWKKGGCMQDFAMKIITSGTTLAELGRDCHTQAMVCHPRRARCRSASALYTAPHVSPPRSCTRLRHRGIHIAPPACFGLPSICHILPLQARTQSAVQSYLSFVDRFGGEGAASEPGGFKASAGPPPAAGMLCCYSERCKGAPKAAEAFSATQR